MAALNVKLTAAGICTNVASVVSSSTTGSKKLRPLHFLPLKPNALGFYVAERILPRHLTSGRGGVDQAATFMCRLYAAPHSNDRDGADLLDEFLQPDGPSSVSAAIESDLTAGGGCQQLIVRGVEAYAVYVHADASFIGAQWRVEVW